ncbi:MAG: complex I NDUFA9 subunit family protein [Rhizomicrobium sp.]
MNELVTVFGASGFIGRHVVRALALDGWRIRAVCRQPNLAEFLMTSGVPGQIELYRGNVRDPNSIAAALNGADAAVNLVGVLYGQGRQNFEAMHVDAAAHIAEAAHAAGIGSLIHMSAVGANRTAPSRYAQTKGEGEMRVREAFADAVILRPSLVFGPEDDFFNKFAWLAQMSPALPLISGGHTRFQPVYAGDVAAAVARALTDSTVRGKTFELGGPTIYSFKELLRYILALCGRKRLLLPLPGPVAKIIAFFLQIPSSFLPIAPLLTVDQIRLLANDAVVADGAFTLADLSIRPHSVEEIVPGYLKRFNPFAD